MAAQHKQHKHRTHRKPGRRPLGGTAARTVTTLALAGAATAGVLGGSAVAAPGESPAQVRDRVDRLHREAEAATEKYHGAKERAQAARSRLERLRDEAARRTQRLNSARQALGSAATAQYREGSLGPAVRLALADDPEGYLRGAAVAERAGERQARTVKGVRGQLRELARLRGEAARVSRRLAARERELARHKRTVQDRLGQARRLLARLTAEERARVEREQQRAAERERTAREPAAAGRKQPARKPAGAQAPAPPVAAPGTRAAAAVAYAYRALGKPYVWGATGPDAFDCSGLTQAAYRTAGVALPRTTYTQINAGRRVARGQLRPGDLVFFYSGITHVGIYVGGGKMIHAPKPGAPVRVAPVGSMPFAGAARVA